MVTAQMLEMVSAMLERAHKFILPDSGLLMDVHPSRINAEIPLDMVRPPFPVTAAEYRMSPQDSSVGDQAVVSTRRIALIFDLPGTATAKPLSGFPSHLLHFLHKRSQPDFDFSEGALGVISVFSDDGPVSDPRPPSKMIWRSSIGMAVVPYRQAPASELVRNNAGNPRLNSLVEETRTEIFGNNAISRKTGYRVQIMEIFTDLYANLVRNVGPDKAWAITVADAGHELLAALNLGLALNCANIGTDTIPAPAALNRKRARNGKPPLYEYRILVVHQGRSGDTAGERPGITGRLSPRMHFRRGHIRRLGENRAKPFVWVSPTTVGSRDQGVIDKTYDCRAPDHRDIPHPTLKRSGA